MTEQDYLILKIFTPYAAERIEHVLSERSRFVHYTTSEVAVSIIRNKSVWMRNAVVMNDFSEIQHGFDCLKFAWSEHESGRRCKELLDLQFPGFVQEITNLYDGWHPDMQINTFITCLSEHSSDEDEHGRLSMWRAYGGRSGVALVLSQTPFVALTDELKAFSSPVMYASKEDFAKYFSSVVENISSNAELMRSMGRQHVLNIFFHLFRMAVLCTKHPGFAEEREWRVIYSPSLGVSRAIEKDVQVVRGVPQVINKIPLRNSPDEGLFGVAIPDLLERIIIGPTDDQLSVYQAFTALLDADGIKDSSDRVLISGIPLRQS